MKNNDLMVCGVLAPVLYAATVLTGGLLRPGYSHVSQFVSELIATGAPNKWLLDPVFIAYNLLTIAFAMGLFVVVRASGEVRRRLAGSLGSVILMLEGIFGLATLFFPQDPIGTPITATGTMHMMLAGLSSLTSMLPILLMGFWFRYIPSLRQYGAYSFVSVALVFAFGGLAAYSGAVGSPIAGLIERLTIGAFLQWMFVVGLRLLSFEARPTLASGSYSLPG
jgi:hypothetical protein